MNVRLTVLTALVLMLGAGQSQPAEPVAKPAAAKAKTATAPRCADREFEQVRANMNSAVARLWEKQLDEAAPRLFAMVKGDASGELTSKVMNLIFEYGSEELQHQAGRIVQADCPAKEKIHGLLALARLNPQHIGHSFLERVAAVNPDRAVKARALLILAYQLLGELDQAHDPQKQKALVQQTEAIARRVKNEFATVEVYGKPKFAGEVADQIVDRLALRVGQPFPELEGLSVAGSKEHVANYRGKVVVFDVWATWCGPCKAMIPHEREMVEKLKGQPFALISVSADQEKADLDKFLAKTPMPWVHWWGQADDGKVLKALGIQSYPTIYVLDAKGVIRFKNVRGDDLTKAVETCLAEIKK